MREITGYYYEVCGVFFFFFFLVFVWLLEKERILGGVVLRWLRNRTGRPLSPSQINQTNI